MADLETALLPKGLMNGIMIRSGFNRRNRQREINKPAKTRSKPICHTLKEYLKVPKAESKQVAPNCKSPLDVKDTAEVKQIRDEVMYEEHDKNQPSTSGRLKTLAENSIHERLHFPTVCRQSDLKGKVETTLMINVAITKPQPKCIWTNTGTMILVINTTQRVLNAKPKTVYS